MTMFGRVLAFVMLFCMLHCKTLATEITIEGKGYRGIVVAVHKSVPEDVNIVENIKTLFSKASQFLYNSTKGGVYFKEVTIVIPPTWETLPGYETLPGSFFGNAHIRVDQANPLYGDAPYTLQPGGCGEHGEYIHLTPWFLAELNGKTMEMFGAPERQLIHEWAHLRYGVFDEYGIPGDKRFPMFYYENGKVRPTSCVRDIKGWIESRDGGPCFMTEDGQVAADCIFIPNMQKNEAKASIMYMPFIPSMEGFCDDADHQHNVKAPTKQNAVCNYRSTFDVISRHKDFEASRVKRDVSYDLTETIFRLIQTPKDPAQRYVLALDVSGSMNGQPMKLLHKSATRLVEDRIPDGSFVGIVQFSTEASILRNLTKVDDKTRLQISSSLPIADDGGRTAIGKGLQEAIRVLKFENDNPEGGLIMLITDGEENVVPYIDEVLPEILKLKIIVNAVAFGPEASQKLENLTTLTGGRGYFFSNIDGSRPATALDSAFLESITSQSDIELQPVQLKDETFALLQPEIKKSVYVDEELGKDTVFTITSPYLERVEVTVESPSGWIFDSTSTEYSRDDPARQRIQITFKVSEVGKWVVTFLRRGDHPIVVGFAVISKPKDARNQPIRVRSWLNEVQLKFPAYAKVYAEVKKGYQAVVAAHVVATVERPLGGTVDIELRDDGLGADITEDDGIYTGYFTHFNGNGRYAVVARVSNDGQARLKLGRKASASPYMPHAKGKRHSVSQNEFTQDQFRLSDGNATEDDDNETDMAPASKFDRSSNSGAFRLESWEKSPVDRISPGDITNLQVISALTLNDTAEVALQWTTPGDDIDVGKVTSLELRASLDMEELLRHFDRAALLNETDLTSGTLTPTKPRHKQMVTVSIPEHLQVQRSESWTLYFAVKARDEAGNPSAHHNIAPAHFGISKKASAKQKQEQKEEEKPKEAEDGSFKWWPLIVGVFTVSAIVMILVVVVVVILKASKTQTYSSVLRNQIHPRTL